MNELHLNFVCTHATHFQSSTKLIFNDSWINPLYLFSTVWCDKYTFVAVSLRIYQRIAYWFITHPQCVCTPLWRFLHVSLCLWWPRTSPQICYLLVKSVQCHAEQFPHEWAWWVWKIINLIFSVNGKFKETEIFTSMSKLFTLLLVLEGKGDLMWKVWWVRKNSVFLMSGHWWVKHHD